MTTWSKWTPERIDEAARLWRDGMPGKTIALRMGVSWGSLSSITCNYRHLFPARMKTKFSLPSGLREAPAAELLEPFAPRRTFFEGRYIEHVKRKTRTGAVVTMPKVSFIDEAREAAE
jgi:hypothetical protein